MKFRPSANGGVRGANTPVNERVPGVGSPGNSIMGADTPARTVGAGMNDKVLASRKFPDTSAGPPAPRGGSADSGPAHIVRYRVPY
jgi:hypothetical protein